MRKTVSSRRHYVSARSAAVSAIAQRKRKYCKNQIASCAGNQGKLFKVIDGLMERRSDPILSHSLCDADLASSFSEFFSEKITHIRRELDLTSVPVFSQWTSMLIQG